MPFKPLGQVVTHEGTIHVERSSLIETINPKKMTFNEFVLGVKTDEYYEK
jgi:hypothetical protein